MTTTDADRYAQLRMLGCLACTIAKNVIRCGRVEVHHLVDKGNRELSGGNSASVPLGAWHHRGEPPRGHTVKSARAAFGPSMFHESKLFRETYGTQRELLAMANELLQVYS